MADLTIKNLSVEVDSKKILDNFNIQINSGEIHAIMGPNGTGKSTLSRVIMGDSKYKILDGTITYDNKKLNNMTTDERARLGIFLGMQMPTEIEGVTNADLLRTACHSKEKDSFKLMPFIKKIDTIVEQLNMDKDMVNRCVNTNFSGGEKKKNEILQMYMLEPSLVILDEVDSGLDVDSLKVVAENIMKYYKQYKPAILLITHYQRLLDYIVPDFIHIMMDGYIIKSGKKNLAKIVEDKGYDYIKKSYLNRSSIIEEKEVYE